MVLDFIIPGYPWIIKSKYIIYFMEDIENFSTYLKKYSTISDKFIDDFFSFYKYNKVMKIWLLILN